MTEPVLSPSDEIDAIIGDSRGWRGEVLTKLRQLILATDPDVVEEIKWRKPSNPRGVPVWSHTGMICTAETYKDKVKLTFVRGALQQDPAGLFNSSLGGAARRAIDFFEGDTVDEAAFRSLVQDAIALNAA